MMRFRLNGFAFLREEADPASEPPLEALLPGALVRTWDLIDGSESAAQELSNGFVHVKVDVSGLKGWVEEGALEVDTPDPVNEAGFVRQCLRIEAVLNDMPAGALVRERRFRYRACVD